jgi:hypothetical protein
MDSGTNYIFQSNSQQQNVQHHHHQQQQQHHMQHLQQPQYAAAQLHMVRETMKLQIGNKFYHSRPYEVKLKILSVRVKGPT